VYRLAFRPFAPGLEVGELSSQAHRWSRTQRLVVVREEPAVRSEARGRELFHAPGYRFRAVVTTLSLTPEDVWHPYGSRADTENRPKELKRAFGADGFCSSLFWATEAALRCICLLYNLIEKFQRALSATARRTLSTLRTTVFACGAILGRVGRQERFLDQLQRLLGWILTCNAATVGETNP